MKILIGFEESQKVLEQFLLLGFDAYSNDIIDCSGNYPNRHLKMDFFEAFNLIKPDATITFPPCTHLSAAGAPSWKIKQKDGRQQEAFETVIKINKLDCRYIAIENPTGFLNSNWRKPDQIINPYQFGEPFKKRTCLWLKGFPKLKPTNIVEPKYHYTSNSYRGGLLKDGTRKISELPVFKSWDNARERSKTFQGIAEAMATQWGSFLLNGY